MSKTKEHYHDTIENNMLTTVPYISVIIICLLMLIITLQVVYRRDTKADLQQLQSHVDSVLIHRTYLDSMYWEHLENCSFIHNDSIAVGYNGYLYNKYY